MRESRHAGKLHDYEAFVAVVEVGNLTRAAVRLQRSLQSVSRSLAALEDQLGVVLVRRTTRTARPTDAGLTFYQRVSIAMRDITQAATELRDASRTLRGQVRVGAPVMFGGRYVVPAMHAFSQKHPGVRFDLSVLEDPEPPLRSGIDVGIRVGKLPSSPLKSRKIGSVRRVVVATPRYLQKRGRPDEPRDLLRHACLVQTGGRDDRAWTFTGPDGAVSRLAVKGSFECDSAHVLDRAVAAGMGVAVVPLFQARDEIARGKLEILLEDFALAATPVHAVWATSPRGNVRTHRFVEALARRLKRELR